MSEENNSVQSEEVEQAASNKSSLRKHIFSAISGKSLALTLSLLANLVLVGYHGFYAHRTNENKILSDQYSAVQTAQVEVFNSLIGAVPSKRTGDKEPDPEDIKTSLEKIDALQVALSSLNRGSPFVKSEAYDYQEAIGALASAVIDMNYEEPASLSNLQAAFHNWDVAANDLKEAIDSRTASFWKTVVSVI